MYKRRVRGWGGGQTLMPPHRPQMLHQLQTSTLSVPRLRKHKPFQSVPTYHHVVEAFSSIRLLLEVEDREKRQQPQMAGNELKKKSIREYRY